jgi:hypothetical protein
MFARLFSNNTSIQTAYSEISKVITGAITSPASLTAFNTATSTIVTTQPSNWYEYTTVGANNQVTAGTVIWFRQRSKSGVWKYAGLYRASSPATVHKGILNHYTGDSPSVQATSIGTATNNSAVYGATTEYTIAAGSRYLVIASKLTTDAHFTDIHMWLEYPNNSFFSQENLPDHIMYRHIGTGATYGSNASTDLNFPTGIIEYSLENGSLKVLRGGMPPSSTQQATMKPNTYTTFANTVDSSGAFIEYPTLPLYTESLYSGFLDCSTLTGILGAGTGIGNYGDVVIINGIQYAFLKANASLSYLVPYR